jgi:hypothetical protein
MRYLIDGYNLLHALGLGSRLGPTGLEWARLRLLRLLRETHGDEASDVTVVFDAAGARPGATAEQDYRGIHVLFAVREVEADDLIEQLIRRTSAPRGLTVVSDDHRIQQAARRRDCVALGCAAYLDFLDHKRHPQPPRPPEAPAKPEEVSPEEAQYWLREFAGLGKEPDTKELFDPYGFLEGER